MDLVQALRHPELLDGAIGTAKLIRAVPNLDRPIRISMETDEISVRSAEVRVLVEKLRELAVTLEDRTLAQTWI